MQDRELDRFFVASGAEPHPVHAARHRLPARIDAGPPNAMLAGRPNSIEQSCHVATRMS